MKAPLAWPIPDPLEPMTPLFRYCYDALAVMWRRTWDVDYCFGWSAFRCRLFWSSGCSAGWT